MTIHNLKSLYILELQDMQNGCSMQRDAVVAMRDAATDEALKEAIGWNLDGIDKALEMFDTILDSHGADKAHDQNKGLTAIAEEAEDIAVSHHYEGDRLRDVAICSRYRYLLHYALAGFERYVDYAETLGLDADLKHLIPMRDAQTEGLKKMDAIAARLMAA